MRIDIGHFSLLAAWLLALYASCSATYAAIVGHARFTKSATNAIHASTLFALLSLLSLAHAFINHDYRYTYVWQHSNSLMPFIYQIAAVWGGMDGSLLLWAAILSAYISLSLLGRSSVIVSRKLFSWYVAFTAITSCYFGAIVIFMANPFKLLPSLSLAKESGGLNPLLQNPSMIIHPPMLYLGVTGFVIPFAYALAALISGEVDARWIKASRFWQILSWTFLSAGIVLGGNWAYIELGWGGFWAWDPVENASLLPWLISAGLLHSGIAQEHRGMFKAWNISLGIGTYLMTVFGAFITRSGIVQSVHAFGASSIGWVFGLFIGLTLALACSFAFYRKNLFMPDQVMTRYISREGLIFLNNLLFVGITFCIISGVMLPVLSEYFTGNQIVVGSQFFNTVTGSLFLAIFATMGTCLWIGWNEGDSTRCHLGVIDLKRLSHPRYYGSLLIHLGAVIMAISIIASMTFKIEKDFALRKGEQVDIGKFSLELGELVEISAANYQALRAEITVRKKDGKEIVGHLFPEHRYYPASDQTTTEVDIRVTPTEDLYIAFAGIEQLNISQNISNVKSIFKAFVNPLQVWLWIGSFMLVAGGCVISLLRFKECAKIVEGVRL